MLDLHIRNNNQDATSVSKKRTYSKEVTPIIDNNIRYEAPHFYKEKGSEQIGGYIVARDILSSKELWIEKIYSNSYEDGVESDKQNIFIKNITLIDDKEFLKTLKSFHPCASKDSCSSLWPNDKKFLKITNELDQQYFLNLSTLEVFEN